MNVYWNCCNVKGGRKQSPPPETGVVEDWREDRWKATSIQEKPIPTLTPV